MKGDTPAGDMIKNFDQVIGSGGFGLIVRHSSEPLVAKLLYDSSCDDAEIEYKKHLDIYKTFRKVKNPEYSKLCVSKPLAYDRENVIFNGNMFSCFYIMTLLNSLGNEGLYHIIDDSYKHTVDRAIGRVYSQKISDANPSRGFFASYSYMINNNLLLDHNIGDLIRYMGYSFGVITFLAEYYPKDVEYTLGADTEGNPCFCVLDFGMVYKIDFDDIAEAIVTQLAEIFELDLYFPTDNTNKKIFMEGMKDALNIDDISEKKRHIFHKFKEEIDI